MLIQINMRSQSATAQPTYKLHLVHRGACACLALRTAITPNCDLIMPCGKCLRLALVHGCAFCEP